MTRPVSEDRGSTHRGRSVKPAKLATKMMLTQEMIQQKVMVPIVLSGTSPCSRKLSISKVEAINMSMHRLKT